MIAVDTLSEGLLLRGQRQWVADTSPLKVIEKGRRTGITWGEASDDVMIAASSREAGGMNVYYFPQAKEDAIEYIETCGKWARAFGHAVSGMTEGDYAADELGMVLPEGDPDKYIRTYRIQFASGYRIVALSSAPSRARGKQGVFVLDEAAFHPHLPGVLKAVMATFLRGGRVRVISTHNGEGSPFNELITEIRSGRRRGTVHRYTFRDAIADGMYRRICELNGEPWSVEKEAAFVAEAYGIYGDDAEEELDAIPKSGTGTYLSNVLIRARMTERPVLRLGYDDAFAEKPEAERQSECAAWLEDHLDPLLADLPPHLNYHYGMDFGRTGDLSVIAPGYQDPLLKLRSPFLVEMRNVPFDQQEQVLFHLVDRLPRFVSGANDSRGNGQSLAEHAWQKYGKTRVDAVMLSQSWYRDNMPAFKRAFEDGTIEIPRDADLQSDLRAIKMDKGVAKIPEKINTSGSDGKPRHGDAAIALALLHYAATGMEPAPIEFTAAPDKMSRWDPDPAHDHDLSVQEVGAW